MTPRLQDDVAAWQQEQDEAAARRLIDALYPQVIRIVRNHLPFRLEEEDLAQEVFAQFFKTLDRYDPARPLENWLSRLALHVCLKALRSRQRRPELRWSDLAEEERHAAEALRLAEPDAPSAGAETRALLHHLMDSLSAEDRMVITLFHLEEKSLAEIQTLTGWSSVVIRMRAYRARRKLQRMLEELPGAV
jgi:RNA polymerase sigma-70 factor (ECF subfamily)